MLRTERLLLRPFRLDTTWTMGVFEYAKDPEWAQYLGVLGYAYRSRTRGG